MDLWIEGEGGGEDGFTDAAHAMDAEAGAGADEGEGGGVAGEERVLEGVEEGGALEVVRGEEGDVAGGGRGRGMGGLLGGRGLAGGEEFGVGRGGGLAEVDAAVGAEHVGDEFFTVGDENGDKAAVSVEGVAEDGRVQFERGPVGVEKVGGQEEDEGARGLEAGQYGVGDVAAGGDGRFVKPDGEAIGAEVDGDLAGAGFVFGGVADEDVVFVCPGHNYAKMLREG